MELDFFQLQCFSKVVQTKSFSEASFVLSSSQSSVSKHIAKLEAELGGIPLFDRSKRNVTLTNSGEEFYLHVQTLLKDYTDMLNSMQKFNRNASICFGCIENIGRIGLTTPISTFMEEHPEIEFSMKLSHTWHLLELLNQSKVNPAIINIITGIEETGTNMDGFDLSNFHQYVLDEDQYYAIVNQQHPLAKLQSLKWEDLENERLLMFDKSYSVNKFIHLAFQCKGIRTGIVFECNVVDNLLGLVADNAGITFLPASISRAGYAARAIPIAPPLRRTTALLVSKNSETKKHIQQFVDLLLEYYST